MAEAYKLKKPANIKLRKRVGRGTSSGSGKTSARGQKGQMSRSGAKRRAWFEGGQMPIQRRVPKRGFNNSIFKKVYATVSLARIAKIGAGTITKKVLMENGVIKCDSQLVKILGTGELAKAVTIEADAFSASALEKITKAGGEAIMKKKKKTTTKAKGK
jgi:large subunit ribosomal protein L15